MKKLVTSYTFTAAAKTIASADFTSLEKVQLITNVTDQVIIYNFADTTKGATLSGTTLTLEYDTTTMDDADKLQIFVEDGSATQAVSVASLPLPSGAATSAKQDTGNTSLASIDGKITAVNTGAVVVSSSALPTSAATSTKQSDGSQKTQIVDGAGNVIGATSNALDVNIAGGNVTLNATDIEIGQVELKDSSSSTQPRVLTTDPAGSDGGLVVRNIPSGTQAVSNAGTFAVQADTELTTADLDTGAGTDTRAVVGLVGSKSGGGVLIPGDATAGLKVDLGADNDVTVTGSVTANAGTNLNTSALALESGGNLATVAGAIKAEDAVAGTGDTGIAALSVRRDSAASSAGTDGDYATINTDNTGRVWVRVGATDTLTPGTGATNLGKAEDAAHASGDTGVFALGVRNDGAATSFSGTNGDYTPIGVDAAGTVSVVQKSGTATLSNVASSATSVTVLAANTARKAATVYNDSTQILYLKFGATASTSSFTVKLAADTYYEVPGGYTGIMDGIWASANGSARVTEIT